MNNEIIKLLSDFDEAVSELELVGVELHKIQDKLPEDVFARLEARVSIANNAIAFLRETVTDIGKMMIYSRKGFGVDTANSETMIAIAKNVLRGGIASISAVVFDVRFTIERSLNPEKTNISRGALVGAFLAGIGHIVIGLKNV